MSDYLGRQVEFVAKLVRMSQERRIDWQLYPSGGFVAQVLGRQVRVFETDRASPAAMDSVLRFGRVRNPVLEILADNGTVVHSIEGVTGLRDLLASAAFRAGHVSDFMDQVLAS